MAKGKTTAVTVAKSYLPANFKQQLADEAAEIANRIQAPTGNKIKLTKKKTFKLPNGQESEGPLTLVIVDFVSINKFFDRPYSEKDFTPPACFAVGLDPKNLVPTDKSPDKQHDTCKGCPNDEFGSKGNGKACSNVRLLAVVPGEGDEAADPNADMWVIEVSPTAIKAFDAYVSTVRTQYGVPPIGVVTDVFFDPAVDHQSLRFGNPQENPNLEVHFQRKAAARELLMQVPDFSTYKPLPKKGSKK